MGVWNGTPPLSQILTRNQFSKRSCDGVSLRTLSTPLSPTSDAGEGLERIATTPRYAHLDDARLSGPSQSPRSAKLFDDDVAKLGAGEPCGFRFSEGG